MSKRKTNKKYSSSQRASWKAGFFAGLFARKKTNKSLKKAKQKRTLNDIPLNYQHNVLFSDGRYQDIYRSYVRKGCGVSEAYKLAIPKYKKKYGDSVLKEHYDIT